MSKSRSELALMLQMQRACISAVVAVAAVFLNCGVSGSTLARAGLLGSTLKTTAEKSQPRCTAGAPSEEGC